MNFLSLDFIQSSDLPHVLFLPTYAATAWYHNALPRKRPSLPAFLKEVERFASGEYANVLLKGDLATGREKKEVLEKLHRYTGLDKEFLERSRLKVAIMQFCKELLRKQRRTVGRLDSRITGYDADPTGHQIEHDPSMSALMPPYTMAFNDYVRRTLKYETELKYHVFHGITKPWTWDVPKDEMTDTSHALRDAMLRNPHMRVFVASGYYDLATPYYATAYTLSHLGLEPDLRAKIETEEYEAGHMMYTHVGCLQNLYEDVKQFVAKA